MMLNIETKYHVDITSNFKKQYKKVLKQNKDIDKFIYVLEKLANGEKLDRKFKNH